MKLSGILDRKIFHHWTMNYYSRSLGALYRTYLISTLRESTRVDQGISIVPTDD